ncbi:MAG TPA: hypothetical protein VND93_29795 [Myxococcales bacterium]|jgi:hypothetical protein|nr:hypothetical protein [Myxococcales bacterium]
MGAPKQIVPGLFHWTTIHPDIHIPVSSYWVPGERIVIDPLIPSPGGLAWLKKRGPPEHVLLTSGLHYRHAAKLAAAFGCTVWCPRKGLRRLPRGLKARGYDPGDRLPGGARAVGIGGICPDESALLFPALAAVAVADGVIRRGSSALMFVPEEYMVDDPADAPRVKRQLKRAYLKLVERPFKHLLLAHGNPWLRDGRAALRAFAKAP